MKITGVADRFVEGQHCRYLLVVPEKEIVYTVSAKWFRQIDKLLDLIYLKKDVTWFSSSSLPSSNTLYNDKNARPVEQLLKCGGRSSLFN